MNFAIFILITFTKFNVSIPGKIQHVDLIDLNGDGIKEIVTIGKSKRIKIYEWEKENFFECLDTVVTGDLIDFGNVLQDEQGNEIVLISNDRIQIFKYMNRNLYLKRELTVPPSIIYPEHSCNLRRGKAVFDVEGRHVILFFYPYSCILLNSSSVIDSFNVKTHEILSTRLDRSLSEEGLQTYYLKSSYIIPLVFFVDIIGDSNEEFVQFFEDTLFCNDKALLNLYFLRSYGKNIRIFPPKIVLKDINNDGKVDLLFCKSDVGSGFGKRSSVYLFINRGNGFAKLPDQVIISESFSPDIFLKDVNNDGKLDLILTTSGFNLFSLIKLILTRKMDIQYSIYLYEKNSFTKTPVYTKTFGMSLNSNSNLSGGKADFSVDFDGDGWSDILYFKGNKVEVYKGNGKSFSKKPSATFNIKTSSKYIVTDIDDNGNPDILFWNVNHNETELWGLLR